MPLFSICAIGELPAEGRARAAHNGRSRWLL